MINTQNMVIISCWCGNILQYVCLYEQASSIWQLDLLFKRHTNTTWSHSSPNSSSRATNHGGMFCNVIGKCFSCFTAHKDHQSTSKAKWTCLYRMSTWHLINTTIFCWKRIKWFKIYLAVINLFRLRGFQPCIFVPQSYPV